jgi:hypothetical protein
MSVQITGSPTYIGETIYGYLTKLMAGEPLDRKIMRKLIPISKDNVDQAIQAE